MKKDNKKFYCLFVVLCTKVEKVTENFSQNCRVEKK